jgi:sterol desaturase/sphingolipid hydroxylase (fatty acid hydroxylase superfamily)
VEEWIAALGQGAFYAAFAGPPVLAAWGLTHNVAFAASFSLVAAGIVFLAVHVHDAVHCLGHSPLERFGWFWWLDRHHYLHHLDTRSNVNFLLPLGDLVFGTLRREMTSAEQQRWPSYEQARASVGPSCKRTGALTLEA